MSHVVTSFAKNTDRAAASNGLVVLMARIVDCDGAAVRPMDVAAIEYSIYRFDPRRPSDILVVGCHDAVSLDVGAVFLESLQFGRQWTVDNMGYNFRHEIVLGEDEMPRPVDWNYVVRYVMKSVIGETMIVRFQLKVVRA